MIAATGRLQKGPGLGPVPDWRPCTQSRLRSRSGPAWTLDPPGWDVSSGLAGLKGDRMTSLLPRPTNECRKAHGG